MSSEVPATGPAPAVPVQPTPGPFARGTLGRRLVVRVVALVAGVALALGLITTLGTQQLLLQTLDDRLDEVSGLLRPEPGKFIAEPGGQPDGTFYVVFDSDRTLVANGMLTGLQVPSVPDAAIEVLSELPVDQQPRSAVLPVLGSYRVVSQPFTVRPNRSELILVTGIPAADVDRTLTQLIIVEAILAASATLGALLIARPLVARNLRPLNRVAGVAQQVSQLRLDRGDVAVGVRVPPGDADPTSEVGRVGQALNHLLNNVDGALAVRQASQIKLQQFVADASHELRNPLAAIRGYAELTQRERDQLSPDTAYALERMESESDRMSVLVEDLLLLARLDSRPDLDLQSTDLSELVINAVNDARVAGGDHAWELDLPPEPIVAVVDRHRVHQVVANLLANARTHTPAGTRVLTRLSAFDNWVKINVSDNGPGIPADIRDHVFERFTRAEQSRARVTGAAKGGSTGLGLAIVAAVVEAHQGVVSVDSGPGRTEFTVTLPIAAGSF